MSQAITKEALLKRKQELETQQEKLISSLNVVNGAIQDCEYWLEELKKQTPLDK